jgi:hypothetical protein
VVAKDYTQQLRHFEYSVTGKKNIREPINEMIYHNRIHEENKNTEKEGGMMDILEIDFDVIVEIPE